MHVLVTIWKLFVNFLGRSRQLMTDDNTPVEYSLKYFPMRGRGEPVRLMLELNGLNYTEVGFLWEFT